MVFVYYICNMIIRLKEILEDKNMSVAELVRIMSKNETPLSRLSIYNIIDGKNSPKVCTMENIAFALDLGITDMFYTEIDSEKTKQGLIKNIINNANKLLKI